MKQLTFIILTYNEEKTIVDCLDSLKGIPAQTFVVDSFSTDGTLEILKQKKVEFTQHDFENYSTQRNWAQENNPFKTEWVFHLDADERLTPELKDWLLHHFPKEDKADAFIFSRRAMFMNKWIQYGGQYPIYHLRLFRASKGKCESKSYDQHFICSGIKKTISRKDIINILSDNLTDFIARHNKWALMEAIEYLRLKKTGEVQASISGNPIERKRWMKNNIFEALPLFLRSFLFFNYRYFFRLGFLDGKEGLIFHILQGFWFRFLVDAKIYELKKEMKTQQMTLDQLIALKYNKSSNG